jgi:hypothetical protein
MNNEPEKMTIAINKQLENTLVVIDNPIGQYCVEILEPP